MKANNLYGTNHSWRKICYEDMLFYTSYVILANACYVILRGKTIYQSLVSAPDYDHKLVFEFLPDFQFGSYVIIYASWVMTHAFDASWFMGHSLWVMVKGYKSHGSHKIKYDESAKIKVSKSDGYGFRF
jgi:hypothetical protein